MTQIVLDATLAGKLQQAGQEVELCDPSGKVIGRYLPLPAAQGNGAGWGPRDPQISEEEICEREQSAEWYSTEEVQAHLEKL
jgi:hypothetical protein